MTFNEKVTSLVSTAVLGETCMNKGSLVNTVYCNAYGDLTLNGNIRWREKTDCASHPCENGGNCTDGDHSHTCACPEGFTGMQCATNVDDCASNPCQHDGDCIDGINSYSCSCAKGYSGRNCEINIDDCASDPCENGGTCIDKIVSYSCSCAKGYSGTNCETKIDSNSVGSSPQGSKSPSGQSEGLVPSYSPSSGSPSSGSPSSGSPSSGSPSSGYDTWVMILILAFVLILCCGCAYYKQQQQQQQQQQQHPGQQQQQTVESKDTFEAKNVEMTSNPMKQVPSLK